jgi:hypoxanthine phosphoribosyltransferase
MGEKITRDYKDKKLTLIIIANGAVFFGADLAREIDLPIWVDVLPAGSYCGHASTGIVECRGNLKLDVKDRHILLVDEVFDTGTTIKTLKEKLSAKGALSVAAAVMIDKEVPRDKNICAEYVGFKADNRYLIGYGMDSHEEMRNLDYIGVID